ncbi:MAG: 3-hydroxyacyl-CoA dehydrogenase NAD-binding domain-containing protein [Anaerolineales bacterium]
MAPNETPIRRIAIVGGGTMGSGIALAALYAGLDVSLQDISGEILKQADAYLRKYLERKGMAGAYDRLQLVTEISDLGDAEFWIEAVPEDLELKRSVFRAVEATAAADAVLATNTSTLSVTAIASAVAHPERVVGMHFFNPAAVLPLVEVVKGQFTSTRTVERAVNMVEKMGKTPVIAQDSPGFIVNRVARPFYGEALRLLGEGAADVSTIDAIVESAGFPMGPFRLMDLIGIDVNLAATRSVWEQTYGEPRYQPHPLQARMVRAGTLGRKTGVGFYGYQENGEDPAPEMAELDPGSAAGTIHLLPGAMGPSIGEMIAAAPVTRVESAAAAELAMVVGDPGDDLAAQIRPIDRELPPNAPLLVQAASASLSRLSSSVVHPERLIGFDSLFMAGVDQITLAASDQLPAEVRAVSEATLAQLGLRSVWISETPAMVLPRVVCMLINEAVFAVGEGVADEGTIDQAMKLGVNYPHGPLEWGRALGWPVVLAVLEHLHDEYQEPRYRAAPKLRQWSRRPGANLADSADR